MVRSALVAGWRRSSVGSLRIGVGCFNPEHCEKQVLAEEGPACPQSKEKNCPSKLIMHDALSAAAIPATTRSVSTDHLSITSRGS